MDKRKSVKHTRPLSLLKLGHAPHPDFGSGCGTFSEKTTNKIKNENEAKVVKKINKFGESNERVVEQSIVDLRCHVTTT